jgi:hypothetical protein
MRAQSANVFATTMPQKGLESLQNKTSCSLKTPTLEKQCISPIFFEGRSALCRYCTWMAVHTWTRTSTCILLSGRAVLSDETAACLQRSIKGVFGSSCAVSDVSRTGDMHKDRGVGGRVDALAWSDLGVSFRSCSRLVSNDGRGMCCLSCCLC